MIVVSALMLPVMIVRFYMGVWQMVFIDLPLIVASFWSISAVLRDGAARAVSQELEALDPAAAHADGGGGGADDHQYARRAGSAVRRADRLSCARPSSPSASGRSTWRHKKYRRRSGWLPYAEIAGGHVLRGDDRVRHRDLQLLRRFPSWRCSSCGYYWAGFGTLYQEYQSRLRWLKQRRLELARQA